LREVSAQGCEDLLLQLQIALHYRFGTVPEYLVGYRQSPGNMSSDQERMLRSSLIALTMVLAECPNFSELEKRGLIARNVWEYLKIITLQGRFAKGIAFIWPLLRGRIPRVVKAAWVDAKGKMTTAQKLISNLFARGFRPPAPITLRHFYDYDPADMNPSDHMPLVNARQGWDNVYQKLAELSPLDAAYRPEKYFDKNSLGA
jgi:hypothetical protein